MDDLMGIEEIERYLKTRILDLRKAESKNAPLKNFILNLIEEFCIKPNVLGNASEVRFIEEHLNRLESMEEL